MDQQIRNKIIHRIRVDARDSAEEQRLILLLEKEGDNLLNLAGDEK